MEGFRAGFYARKVGETQREIQAAERALRRLVRSPEPAYVKLGLGSDAEELRRRTEEIEQRAADQKDEVFRLSVEILALRDRLDYYKQQELAHADGSVPDGS